ncbi:MAG: hypothetical protein U5P41_08150 [Gammaproteobacteria bacterium]|nr:hypothetical protein [Gammaproteobacteria bacterium]
MTYQTTFVVVLLLFAMLLTACSNDRQTYFPLDPGTYWRYNIKSTTMDGMETKKYIIQVTQPRDWQGESVPVRTTLAGMHVFYEQNDEGIFRIATRRHDQKTPTAVPDDRHTVLKYPLQPGTSWSEVAETIALYRTGPPQRSEYWIHAPVKLKYVIEATDDSVKVPAGRFDNCLRVQATGRTPNYDAGNYIGRTDIIVDKTDWYAPGVGLVKSVRKETTTGKVLGREGMQTFAGGMVFELEEFERG